MDWRGLPPRFRGRWLRKSRETAPATTLTSYSSHFVDHWNNRCGGYGIKEEKEKLNGKEQRSRGIDYVPADVAADADPSHSGSDSES